MIVHIWTFRQPSPDVCDRAGQATTAASRCLALAQRRVAKPTPHVRESSGGAKAGRPFAGRIGRMRSRVLLMMGTTALLVGGGFALRSTAPVESVQAVSSRQAATPERRNASVSILTEVVAVPTVASPRAPASAAHSMVRTTPPRAQKRSFFARLLLGNGDSRPEPFPRPNRSVSVKP